MIGCLMDKPLPYGQRKKVYRFKLFPGRHKSRGKEPFLSSWFYFPVRTQKPVQQPMIAGPLYLIVLVEH